MVPSLAESLPYVILEGTAAQRQVIATAVGGVAEIFGPTAPSLIEPNNPMALMVAMQRALDDPNSAWLEMEERLAFVRPRFSIGHMTDEIEAFYRELLVERRKESPAPRR